MNTLLTACILEARSPGITEQWPMMVLEPTEKTRHAGWMGIELRPIRLAVAAVPPGEPEMHGPARQFSSWKDACEVMGWPYDPNHPFARESTPPTFVPAQPIREVVFHKGASVGATTLSPASTIRHFMDKLEADSLHREILAKMYAAERIDWDNALIQMATRPRTPEPPPGKVVFVSNPRARS